MRPLICLFVTATLVLAERPQLSGIYPHLAMFNTSGDCGTGDVVPFADRLWVVTYSPHEPTGSDNKLYEITPNLQQIIRRNEFTEITGPGGIHGSSDPENDPVWTIGWDHRSLISEKPVTFALEVDSKGDGTWATLTTLEVPPGHALFQEFTAAQTGSWIRVKSPVDLTKVTASFHYRNHDKRTTTANPMFAGLAKPGSAATGGIYDIWKLGNPRGKGGPWLDTAVNAGEASDPYLLTGFDRKELTLQAADDVGITAEADLTADGDWHSHASFTLKAGKPITHRFNPAFSAYWIRFKSDRATTATAQLSYE
jgi:hypothetical protein